MSKTTPAPVESLFKELEHFIHNNEYTNAIGICDKILKVDANDPEAFHSKVICLIQDSKFDEALAVLDSNRNLASKLIFERAYCLYRQKKLKESLSLLGDNNNFPQPKPKKVLELQAQVYYGLEDFHKCTEVYEQLIKEHKIESPELITNILAAFVASGRSAEGEKLISSYKNHLQTTFEFAYNAGCVALEAGDYDTAEKYLLLAQKVCKDSLAEEQATDEEIQDELSPIFVQLGYVKQMQNKTDEATELYNQVLKAKPSDEGVSAVASNNIVVIKREHDLFNSSKKIKQATSQALEQKLSAHQKKVIGFNRCLLLLHMNKGDQCRELVKQLQEQFPDSDRLAIISSSLFIKEKKPAKSEELLKSFASQHPESLMVQLSLAQLQLDKGNIPGAISALQSVSSLKNKPAIVATLVQLYEQMGDIDSATKTFDDHLSWWESQKVKDEETFVKILKQNANFKLRHKRYQEAANVFEKVLKVNKNDLEALPGLILAYSGFDPKQAEKLGGRLPSIVGSRTLDAEKLENIPPRIAMKSTKQEEGLEKTSKKGETAEKTKKKRKKKKILPNYLSKPIDPERWIPLKQRSYYKKKQRRGKLEKGAQGGVSVGRSVQLEKGKTTDKALEKQTSPTTSPPVERKPNAPQQEGKEPEEKVKVEDKPKGQSAAAITNAKKKQKRKRR